MLEKFKTLPKFTIERALNFLLKPLHKITFKQTFIVFMFSNLNILNIFLMYFI